MLAKAGTLLRMFVGAVAYSVDRFALRPSEREEDSMTHRCCLRVGELVEWRYPEQLTWGEMAEAELGPVKSRPPSPPAGWHVDGGGWCRVAYCPFCGARLPAGP